MTDAATINRAINYATARAYNLIHDYASCFSEREQYEPLEKLADMVQREIITSFCAVLHGEVDPY